jgi:hypothetical protein
MVDAAPFAVQRLASRHRRPPERRGRDHRVFGERLRHELPFSLGYIPDVDAKPSPMAATTPTRNI